MEQIILTHLQIEQKINRLAHQILENTFEEKHFFIAGIAGNGSLLATLLRDVIIQHSNQTIELIEISMNKDQPLSAPIELSVPTEKIDNSCVILIDDVLNSGKTMQYALGKLLERPLRTIKTVALVDRKHRRYPIKADFVGLSLSTTLKEHVEVSLEKGNYFAQLD